MFEHLIVKHFNLNKWTISQLNRVHERATCVCKLCERTKKKKPALADAHNNSSILI